MFSNPERRQCAVRASAIAHAVTLMRTHGTSFASMYLKNQKFSEATVLRVLAANSGQRRIDALQAHAYRLHADARQGSEGDTRQLSYTSRGKPGQRR